MMYHVTITETLQDTVSVDADSPSQAEAAAERDWKSGCRILGAEHFTGVEFKAEAVQDTKKETAHAAAVTDAAARKLTYRTLS